ncbi:unnamed protein product [Closterium sp. NIES-65]|nr:unnamed protein product [Closterium sp. NIES-65]
MATPSVLAFDAEGRAIDFEVWLDDLQLFLQCDRADDLSLFDLTSGASPAPAADADSAVRSNQYKSAQTLYDAVVARYSSPATAALSRLMLPYLFPDLSAFPTVADLITHLRTSDTRYPRRPYLLSSALRTHPPMYIALYYVVARLPDSLRVVRDHFLAVCPTTLTVDLLEKALLAAEEEHRRGWSWRGGGGGGGGCGGSGGGGGTSGGGGGGGGGSSGGDGGSGASGGGGGSGGGEAAEVEAVEAAAEEAVVVEEVERVGVVPSSVAAVVVASARTAAAAALAGHPFASAASPTRGIGTAALGACEAAALGASASALSGTGETALSDRTTLSPLARPVAVSLADPSGGPVLSHFSTVLPCPLPLRAPCRVAASGQVLAAASRSGPESAPCSCRLLSHETLLWHHRLGHPSLPRLRSMASRVLVSGLPQSLPPLPSGPRPSCVPCVEGRLRATPHSSHFPPTEAPLQTLHMDVWGPAPVRGQGYERYFLLVVDDYSRYTTVLPLRSKGAVTERRRVLFSPSARLLSCTGDPPDLHASDSPQQNGIAERRIGMVMDVARTSMMRGCPPFSVAVCGEVRGASAQPSSPGLSASDVPSLAVDGKVGDASVFRVWGSRAFVRDLSADKLSPRAAPCVFLGFPTDAPGWQFNHPSSRRVLSSQDVTFDESVPFYRLFPYRTPSLPPPPDFLVPVPPPVDPLPPQVPAPSGVSQVDAVDPVELLPGGATTGGTGPEGATAEGAEPGGAEPGGAVPGGAGLEVLGRELLSLGSCASGSLAAGGVLLSLEVLLELELELLRPSRVRVQPVPELLALWVLLELELLRAFVLSLLLLVLPLEVWVALVLSLRVLVLSLLSLELPRAPRPYFVPLLQQVLGLSPPVEGPPPVQSQPLLEPSSPLPAPSPYTGPTGGLAERREPASRPASPVRAARASGRSSRQRPPPVPGTHRCLYSDSLRAASPTVTRLLATVVTDPSFESTAASALVAELVDFAARCRLDYAASLVAESASVCPPSVGGECALGTDVLEDRQEELLCLALLASPHLASVLLAPEETPDALDIPTPRSYAEAVEGPYSSQWQAAMDAEMASWKSTGTYVDAVPPPGANIVSGMWIFRVKRPPGSPPVFKARYVARGFQSAAGS